MASAALSRRVQKVVAYPPLCDMSEPPALRVPRALLDANTHEDVPVSGGRRS
jgi:hypothetical protein